MSKQSTMPDKIADQSDCNIDPYDLIGIVRNLDGSITRLKGAPNASPSSNIPSDPFLLIKDIPVNESKNTWVHLLLPRDAVHGNSPSTKLPLVIFFHGGGFVQFSAGSDVFDNFYKEVVTGIPLMIVSVEYRLAPENRLPAAYNDGLEVLHWINNCKDEWLINYADFTKCFLMGSSSGANIAYHVGLSAAATCIDIDLKPLQIKGLVLIQPFFGGNKRTQAELRLALENEKLVPLCISDVLWELALPLGADRDHEYCNPMVGNKIQPKLFDNIKALGWKILVTGCYGDRLIDRQVEFVKMLEENGVEVMSKFDEGGHHGIDKSETMIKAFCVVLNEFLKS